MNPDVKLEKLTTMLNLLNEGLTKTEFKKAFDDVVKVVKTIKERNDTEIAKMKETVSSLSEALKADTSTDLEDIRNQVQLVLGGQIEAIQAKLAAVQNGKDGAKGDKGDRGERGEIGPRGKSGKDGRDGVDGKDGTSGGGGRIGWGAHPITIYDGTTVIDKNARIINFGSNLTVSRNANGVITVSATGGAGVTELTATGTINSVNTTFTFLSKPTYIFIDGVKYRENEGWTWDIPTLTATVTKAPDYSIWGEA